MQSNRARTELKPVEDRPVLKLSEHATTPTVPEARLKQWCMISTMHMITPLVLWIRPLRRQTSQIAVLHGCHGRVAPRSGLAARHFIDVGAGIVDEDYRGDVGVVLLYSTTTRTHLV